METTTPVVGGGIETMLSVIAGAIVGPILTAGLKRLPWIDAELGSAINLAATLGVYFIAWLTFGDADPALRERYMLLGLAAVGISGPMVNVWRKRVSRRSSYSRRVPDDRAE